MNYPRLKFSIGVFQVRKAQRPGDEDFLDWENYGM